MYKRLPSVESSKPKKRYVPTYDQCYGTIIVYSSGRISFQHADGNALYQREDDVIEFSEGSSLRGELWYEIMLLQAKVATDRTARAKVKWMRLDSRERRKNRRGIPYPIIKEIYF